jgi:Tfp pilus assembly protein PilF
MKEKEHKRETEKYYKHALKADPNDVVTRFNYANFLLEQSRMKEAEYQYKRVLQIDPNNPSAHSNYGLLFYRCGRMGSRRAI